MSDFDTVNEQTDIIPSRCRSLAAQLIPHQRAEFLDDLGRDATLTIINLPFQGFDVYGDRPLLRRDVGNFRGDLRIVGGVKAGANQLDHVGAFAI
ncbi:hypothetical protein [Sphingopyxis sp.]|uniref:hypothetical protein n=1 Tax=Sphingopyxis sp. TaxID=1908224 RepID=UPI002DFD58C2|nr:hypothetical protein [Sphingopyxis sp.]